MKKKLWKRVAAVVLAAAITITGVPQTAFAAELPAETENVTESETENVTETEAPAETETATETESETEGITETETESETEEITETEAVTETETESETETETETVTEMESETEPQTEETDLGIDDMLDMIISNTKETETDDIFEVTVPDEIAGVSLAAAAPRVAMTVYQKLRANGMPIKKSPDVTVVPTDRSVKLPDGYEGYLRRTPGTLLYTPDFDTTGIPDNLLGPLVGNKNVIQLKDERKGNISVFYPKVMFYKGQWVDLKMTATDWKEYENPNNPSEYGLLGFGPGGPGLSVCWVEWINVRYEFFLNGTGTPISVKGYSTWKDIDLNQGLHLRSGFGNIYVRDTAVDNFGYNTNAKGPYYYATGRGGSETSDESHWLTALFSGSTLEMTYTFLKDQLPDGTNSGTSSGGIKSDSSLITEFPRPIEIHKRVSDSDEKNKLLNNLKDRKEPYTYTVSAPVALVPGAVHYEDWKIEDTLDAALNIGTVTVTDEEGTDRGSRFSITKSGNKVTVAATRAALDSSAFYGHTYYVHIPVTIKDSVNLQKAPYWAGSYAHIFNHATVTSGDKTLTSETVETRVRVFPPDNFLKIYKKDTATKEALSGAEFKVYEWNGSTYSTTAYDTLTYNSAAKFYYSTKSYFYTDTNKGKFKIVETKAPANHALTGWSREIVLDGSGSQAIELTVYNPEQHGKIALSKVNRETNNATALGEATLAGAVYEVKNSKNVVVETLTTDENGKAAGKELPLGTYIVKETKASYGFKLDPTVYTVVLAAANQTATVFTKNLTVYEEPQYGQIRLTKVDAETGEGAQGEGTLAGAVYEVYDADGKTADTMTTDENGSALSKKLPLGTYTVKETTASEGYNPDPETYTVELKSTDSVTDVFTADIESKEPPVRGDVTILKYAEILDSEETEANPLAGVEFTITSKTTGEVCAVLTTDGNGYATTVGTAERGALLYDTYILTETKTPDGFEAIEPLEFAIREEHQVVSLTIENKYVLYPVQLVKVDAESDKIIPIAGAEFELLDADGEPVRLPFDGEDRTSVFATDENGQLTLPDRLPIGTYYFEETKAPEGYVLSEKVKFEITSEQETAEPLTVRYADTPAKGKILIEKTDKADGTALAGAVFEIRAAEDIVTPDGTTHERKDALVDTVTTDDKGIAESKELYLGSYTVTEISAPEDYLIDEKNYPVTLAWKDQETKVVTETLSVTNTKMDPKSAIAKLADRTTGAVLNEGRYDGDKTAGDYLQGENVDYTITVTNTGNVELLNVKVEEDPSEDLRKSMVKGSWHYVIPKNQVTEKGNAYTVTKQEGYALTIDRLAVGDSIELHFALALKENCRLKKGVDNRVKVTSEYDDNKKKKPTPEDEDDSDNDKINIVKPELKVAKLADATTGVELVDGRYEGSKKPGVYRPGDKVSWDITVTNSGTTVLTDITVTDALSDELKESITGAAFDYEDGDRVRTKDRNKVTVSVKKPLKVVLDRLEAGDSVVLKVTARIKESEDGKNVPYLDEELSNEVEVTAKYKDKLIPKTPEHKDYDTIIVSKVVPASPKTGDNTPIAIYLGLALLSMAVIVAALRRRRAS